MTSNAEGASAEGANAERPSAQGPSAPPARIGGGAPMALMRHGRTAWNRAHRLQGRADQPLDDEGRAEIAGWRAPAPWDAARRVASPLARARETAELLAPQTAVAVDPRLIEADFGAWEGRRGADLRANPTSGFRDLEDWGWDYRPPEGESVAEVLNRARAALADLARDPAPALLVCHIGVMRALLAAAHGWEMRGPCPFRIKRGRLYPLWAHPDGRLSDPGAPIRLAPEAEAAAAAARPHAATTEERPCA